jgi:zinc transport system substrate-binding protein
MNKKMNRIILFMVSVLGCGLMSGCTIQNDQRTNEEEKLQIVASFYPLAYVADRIAGDRADITNISGATNIHEYNLSPHDVKTLYNADGVILLGANLELWAQDMIEELRSRDVLVVPLVENIQLYATDPGIHGDEHQKNDNGFDEHEHDHGTFDPHIWLDPIAMHEIVNIITDQLITLDPQSSEIYKTHARALHEDLDQVHRAYAEGLASCERESAIVSHDAFGYLSRRYDFTLHPIAGVSTLDEPSAKTLAQIKDIAYNENVTHVLIEKNAVERFAQTIATETQLQTLTIDPISQHTLSDGADYFGIAYQNLDTFRSALGCQ